MLGQQRVEAAARDDVRGGAQDGVGVALEADDVLLVREALRRQPGHVHDVRQVDHIGLLLRRAHEARDGVERLLAHARRDGEVVLEDEDVEGLRGVAVGEALLGALEHRDVRRVAPADAVVVVGPKLADLCL